MSQYLAFTVETPKQLEEDIKQVKDNHNTTVYQQQSGDKHKIPHITIEYSENGKDLEKWKNKLKDVEKPKKFTIEKYQEMWNSGKTGFKGSLNKEIEEIDTPHITLFEPQTDSSEFWKQTIGLMESYEEKTLKINSIAVIEKDKGIIYEEEIERNNQQDLQVNWEDVETFYNFLEPKEDTLVYQNFLKNGSATKQHYITSLNEAKTLIQKNRLDGINCFSINPREEGKTGKESVTKLRTIFIDIDVKGDYKKEGVSKDIAKEEAKQVSKDVTKYLQNQYSIDYGLVVDSGNGYHVYVPVNYDSTFELHNSEVVDKLDNLKEDLQQFNTEKVEIDALTQDLARRVKIAGTHNIKSDMPEDAEIRRAEIIDHKQDFDRKHNTKQLQDIKPPENEEETQQNKENVDKESKANEEVELDEEDKIEKIKQFDQTFADLIEGRAVHSKDGGVDRSKNEFNLATKCVYYGLDIDSCLRRANFGKWQELGNNYQDMTKDNARSQVTGRFDWENFNENPNQEKAEALTKDEDLKQKAVQIDKERQRIEEVREYKDFLDIECDLEFEQETKKKMYSEYADWLINKLKVKPVVIDQNTLFYRYNPKKLYWEEIDFDNKIKRKAKSDLPIVWDSNAKKEIKEHLEAHPDVLFWEEMGLPEEEVLLKDGTILNLDTKETRKVKPEDKALNCLNTTWNPDINPFNPQEFLQDEEQSLYQFIHNTIDDVPNPQQYERLDTLQDLENVDYENRNRKEAMRETLQEYLGYSLAYPSDDYQKMLLILGKTDTGKGTLAEVVQRLMGDNATSQLGFPQLGMNRPFHIHKIMDSMLNIDKEMEDSDIDRKGRIKSIVSKEEVFAERKSDPKGFMVEPKCNLITCSNHPPDFDDTTPAYFNRFLTITATDRVKSKDQINNLEDKLTTEKNLQWLLAWAVKGWERLERQNRFTFEIKEYKTRILWGQFGDSVEKFIYNCLEYDTDEGINVPTTVLYEVYQDFVANDLGDEFTENQFIAKVNNHPDFRKQKTFSHKWWDNRERSCFVNIKSDVFNLKDYAENDNYIN